MNITLCGSIAFYDEMLSVKNHLEQLNHTVQLPPSKITNENGKPLSVKEYYEIRKKETSEISWVWTSKQKAMKAHLDKVAWSDCVLVINHAKNNISGYIGANTLIEMGLALHLNKKIFLFNEVPQLSYTEEIRGMNPTIINGELTLIH